MEFTVGIPDKKTIQKCDAEANPFLIENNTDKIEKILDFLNSHTPLLLVNGFMGTGKYSVVSYAMTFLKPEVITLKYNCFETTILDDILLEFFETFKQLTVQNVISTPKVKTENFTQKINAYFDSIEKPIVIIINSFEQVLKSNKQEILNFISHLSKSYKIKVIVISRKFDYEDFNIHYEKMAITALDKSIFEKYLRFEGFKQIGPVSDEIYKHSRGYLFYTTLSIKIMQYKKLTLGDFLAEYTKSFLSFNDFILREALSLVDPVSGHLFRFLTLMRHPVNIKLLQKLNLYDEEKIKFFVDNFLLEQENLVVYLPDCYKVIAENSIAENIAVKIHKSCVELYETQLPLKPLERDLLVSRQTMRKEIEYHRLFIPKKPVIPQKEENIEPVKAVQSVQPTFHEKDEQIKKISFVFESEADETAILNEIATSINKFVDISDKNNKLVSEIQDLPLTDLINLAKRAELEYDYQKAVMIYQKALTMNFDDDYYSFLPSLYSRLADAFKNMSDWYNALKYYELAVEFFISSGNDEKIYEYKYEIANIYYITFKSDRAEKLLKEIISKDVSINLEIKAKLLLANITGEWYINELPKSIGLIEKNILAELYFKYALNSDKNGAVDKAVKYYRKCVETSHDPKINAYLSSSLTNLAEIYDEEGKSELAVKYLNESLRLDKLTQNYNGIYISTMKLAEILSETNPQKALENLKKARNCAIELNESFYIASSNLSLGDFYYKNKDYKNALNCYNEAYKLAFDNFTKDNISSIKKRIEDIKKVYNEN